MTNNAIHSSGHFKYNNLISSALIFQLSIPKHRAKLPAQSHGAVSNDGGQIQAQVLWFQNQCSLNHYTIH